MAIFLSYRECRCRDIRIRISSRRQATSPIHRECSLALKLCRYRGGKTTNASSIAFDRDAANRGVPTPSQCGGVWRFQVVHDKVAHEARQDDGPLSVSWRPSLHSDAIAAVKAKLHSIFTCSVDSGIDPPLFSGRLARTEFRDDCRSASASGVGTSQSQGRSRRPFPALPSEHLTA